MKEKWKDFLKEKYLDDCDTVVQKKKKKKKKIVFEEWL
jgi:hypothetical protein